MIPDGTPMYDAHMPMFDLAGNQIPDGNCPIHFDQLDTDSDPCPLCLGGVR